MPITKDGETYLETLEAQARAGNRSYTWLADRVHNGRLKRYRFGDSPKPYYKQAEVDALVGHVSVKEEHEPHASRAELAGMHTIPEIARALHISRGYVWRLVNEGRIAAINLGGGGRSADWRVSAEEFERFKRERETSPRTRTRVAKKR
jgi:excisionase family DNA binding protein